VSSDEASSDKEPLGNVAEEAAKLFEALQGWATQSGGEYADATAAAAGGAAHRLHGINEHVATGAPECAYCPLCQVISAVRGTSPEVRQHLASAASSMLKAVAGLMTTPVPDEGTGRHDTSVEKIEVSDDEWEDG
jgi:hypothetical protein